MSAILKMMRCGIGSQCSVSRSVGVMWSKRRMPVISRAAACKTDYTIVEVEAVESCCG